MLNPFQKTRDQFSIISAMKKIAFFLFFFCILKTAFAATTVSGELATTIDLALRRYESFGFSGAILVAYKGKIILNNGYGLAIRDQDVAVTPSTAFAVASITKPFTAAAILKLEQHGKLKTTDPITKYFDTVPDDKTEITIHQLLTHTSGIPDLYAATGITDRTKAVQTILSSSLIAKPGEIFRYSNDGYNLLAAIIEITSGKKFAEFIRSELFLKAGMASSGFWGESNFLPATRVAHNYNMETDNGAPQSIQESWADKGSSDMITTVEDLYRWHLALTEQKIFPQQILDRMYFPYAKRDTDWYYGYGWHHIITPRGTRDFYHGGGDYPRGVTAEFHRYVDEDLVTISICNSMMDDAGLVAIPREIIKAVLFGGEYSLPPSGASVSDPSRYAGTYEISSGNTIRVTFEHAQLVARGEGQQAIGLLTGYKPELNADFEKLNQRVDSLLQNAQKNQFSEELTADQWKQFLDLHGAFQSFEILGTIPVTPGGISTTSVRLHFERGVETYRWVFNKGVFTQILSGTPYPVEAPLVSIQPDRFAAYRLFMKTGARLDFTKDGLAVKSDFGTSIAKRL